MGKICVRIAAIPEREDNVNYMVERLGEQYQGDIKVYYDDDHNGCWWNNKRCWEDIDKGSTHIIVMSDDLILSKNVLDVMQILTVLLPENPISIYGNNQIMAKARDRGDHWAIINGGAWGQFLCTPVDVARGYIKFCNEYIKEEYPHDDGRWTYYLTHINLDTYFTVPSLVQHNTDIDTYMGHYTPTVSKYFIGENKSGLGIDWVKGITKPYRGSMRSMTAPKFLKKAL